MSSKPTSDIIEGFRRKILQRDAASKFYCTILDDKVSDGKKKDAERVGVTLIPAKRIKWLTQYEDPPSMNWLIHHDRYYPQLKQLQHIKHVVSDSPKSQNAAAAIQEQLFSEAQLHDPLTPEPPPAALFVFNAWSKEECGLTGYHRNIVHDFCARKARVGEDLRAYSTVLDVNISSDQKNDAEICGVNLIPAQRKKRAKLREDKPELKWLLHHEIYFSDIKKLENVRYVIGYAPKTGFAAADMKEKLFPDSELVLINHACPDTNYLFNSDTEHSTFEEEMLMMASEADILFSIGPRIYKYFEHAYRNGVSGRKLSDIPHVEILPKPAEIYFDKHPEVPDNIETHNILTYGQLDTQEALMKLDTIAAAVGIVEKKVVNMKSPEWNIQGVTVQDNGGSFKYLAEKMGNNHLQPKMYVDYSVGTLLSSLKQSHLCLPTSYYTDYSFVGLESMACGIPTMVQEDSHMADFIMEHLRNHSNKCIARSQKDNLAANIMTNLMNNLDAFENARILKEDLSEIQAVTECCAKFASLLTPHQTKKTKTSVHDITSEAVPRKEESHNLAVRIILRTEVPDKHLQLSKEHCEDVTSKKEELKAACNKCQAEFDKNVNTVVQNEKAFKEAGDICRKILGNNASVNALKIDSLVISLDLSYLINLYKLKQTCRSGSLPKAFEELLITKKMREDAAKLGITLKLVATYDQETFHELEHFFINGDGGGLEPVEVVCSVIEERSAEKLDIDFKVLDTCVKTKSTDSTLGNSTKIDSKQNGERFPLFLQIDSNHKISQPAVVYAPLVLKSEKCTRLEGQQCDILELNVRMTDRVRNILSHRPETLALMGVIRWCVIGDNDCADKVQELEQYIIQHGNPTFSIATVVHSVSLRARSLLLYESTPKKSTDCKVCRYYLDLAEMEKLSLKSNILELNQELDRAVQKRSTLQMNTKLLENQLEEKSLENSSLKEHLTRQIQMFTEKLAIAQCRDSSLKKKLEKQGQKHTEGTVGELDTNSQEKQNIEKGLQVNLMEPSNEQSEPKLQEKIEGTSKSSAMAVEGHAEKWTKIMISNRSTKSEHKFNTTTGLAFHKDRLLVCDKGNNIVHILNLEYESESVLGSFSGRLSKPFQPQLVAVSLDNLYFILDDNNLLIVVCDESNEIIRIIPLPPDSKPLYIALVGTYVLVTDVKGHKLLVYSQDGQFIANIGDRQFCYPYALGVNSQDTIMVTDCFNHCIWCYDIDLNYKYKYGSRGEGDGQLQWAADIALDEDDNVYLCDFGNHRIIKWSSDGKWVCNLFEREVRHPRYIAVTAKGDRIAIDSGPNEIAVFSKISDPST